MTTSAHIQENSGWHEKWPNGKSQKFILDCAGEEEEREEKEFEIEWNQMVRCLVSLCQCQKM